MISGITARRFTYGAAEPQRSNWLACCIDSVHPGSTLHTPAAGGAFPNKEDNEVTYGK